MSFSANSPAALLFYDALVNNEIDNLRKVVDLYKIDLNSRFTEVRKANHIDLCPVHLVSYKGFGAMLQYLIDCKCDIHITTATLKRQAVHYAALRHQMGCMRKLLAAGAHVNARDTFGNSACHYAAEDGNCDIMRELIKRGAEVDTQDITWKTPLMKATRNGKLRVSEIIIAAGADINKRDEYLNTALHFACRSGSIDILNLLLRNGAKINVQNHWGLTPLMEAVCYNQRPAVSKLIAEGCDLFRREIKTGDTALHLAVKKNYTVISDMLLNAACWDVYVYNYNRESILHDAVIYNRVDIVKLFIYRNFNLTIPGKIYPDMTKKGLFQLAVEKGNMEICKLISDAMCSAVPASEEDTYYTRIYGNQWQISKIENVKSLRQWCRKEVRNGLGFNIESKVDHLPIPETIKDYILCKDMGVHLVISN